MRRLVSMVLSICAMAVFMPAWALAVEESGQAALKAPTVTAFYVVYQDGEKTKEISLLSGDEQQQELILPASTQYTFVVRFDRVEQLDAVYITSTKEDDTKYLEATYDVDANAYIADGAFDSDDANYIPGTLSVSYSQKPVCVTTSDVIAAGVDLNAVKVETDKQGIFSSQSEITGQEGTATAQVVLGEMISGITDASVDATISTLVAGSDIEESELIEWLGVYKDLTEMVSYQLKGEDEKDYTLYLDPDNLLSGNTVLLVVQDVAGHQYTKLVLKKATDNLGWGEIADSLSDVNKIGTALLDYCGISKEATDLKEEVEASTTMTNAQKEEAYQKIQALESDKKLFLIGTTFLPLFVGAGSLVGGGTPALLFSALMSGMTAVSGYFWDCRVGMIQGGEASYAELAVSGMCGEALYWKLNGGGTLTISGHGPMTEFGTIYQVPWVSYAQAQIKKVEINPGATSIGRTSFANCLELTSVSIPDTVESIGDYAFSGCRALEKVTIPGSVSTMGKYVFEDCYNLESAGPVGGNYTIQFGWTEAIPANAFCCDPIKIAVLPDGLRSIGEEAFFLTEIEQIQIPESVTSIGESAFASTNLASVVLPEHMSVIGEDAFARCASLEHIEWPSTVASIGTNAIYGTKYYNDASNWDEGVLYIGNSLLRAKTSVTGKYSIRPGTQCIADGAFYNGRVASYYNQITSILVPDSVTNIGKNAFTDCRRLQGVYFEGDAPTAYPVGTEKSFYESTRLYAIPGKEGWGLDGDDPFGRTDWNGYDLYVWLENCIQDVSISENMVLAQISCGESGMTACCAAYDEQGKLLQLETQNVQSGTIQTLWFDFDDICIASFNVFLMNPQFAPVCQSFPVSAAGETLG